MRHVNSDLMGAPGFELALHQGGDVSKPLSNLVVGDGVFAAALRSHGHPLTIARVPADIRFNPAEWRKWNVPDQAEVKAIDIVVLEELRQSGMRFVRFCDDQQTAGFFIDPVNNPRAFDPPIPESESPQCASRALTNVPSGLPGAG